MSYENEARQLRDLADDMMVVLPKPDHVHGFQRSPNNTRCLACGRKRASVFHSYRTGGRDWPNPAAAAHRG